MNFDTIFNFRRRGKVFSKTKSLKNETLQTIKKGRRFLQEKLEIAGLWWLPENPDFKISGILIFSPNEGFSLKLQGSLKI